MKTDLSVVRSVTAPSLYSLSHKIISDPLVLDERTGVSQSLDLRRKCVCVLCGFVLRGHLSIKRNS